MKGNVKRTEGATSEESREDERLNGNIHVGEVDGQVTTPRSSIRIRECRERVDKRNLRVGTNNNLLVGVLTTEVLNVKVGSEEKVRSVVCKSTGTL